MLQLQRALLQGDASVATLQNRVIALASHLETKPSIPLIAPQMARLQAIQSDEWWQGVTVELLEETRLHLRDLMPLVDRATRPVVYTDFADHFGELREVRLQPFASGVDQARYREKVERFVRASEDHPVVQKIRLAIPLTPDDLAELERYFYAADATGGRAAFEAAYGSDQTLGHFIRQIVGLSRAAAKAKFATYLDAKRFSSDQIAFIDHIINHLTRNGLLDPPRLYEPPFTDIHFAGPDGLFADPQVEELRALVDEINTVSV